MKKIIPSICMLLLLTAGFGGAETASAQPVWVRAHVNGNLQIAGVYHGVGFARYKGKTPDFETLRLAKDRALDDLSYQLSVSIKSTFADRIVKKGRYEDQQLTSSLFISTRQTLDGISIREKWTDFQQHRHWVLLVIAKDRADRQLEQQKFINEVADRLEHRQEEVQKGLEQITLLLNNNMQVYADQVNQIGKLIRVIDHKVADASAQTKQDYSTIKNNINRLEARQKAYAEQISDSQERQQAQIAFLISQNHELKQLLAHLTREIQSDYFLSLADDDLKFQSLNSEFRVTIEPDKGQGATYVDGEKISFRIQASKTSYIKVIYLSSSREGTASGKSMINTLLFPNPHHKDNRIQAGEVKVVGESGELEISAPYGQDVITVIASETQFTDLPDALSPGAKSDYSQLTTDPRDAITLRSRGIRMNTSSSPSSDADAQLIAPDAIATDTCFIVSRPN